MVLREEYQRLRIEKAHTGWSLKELGVSFGIFAGYVYALPSLTFGKTDANISTRTRSTPETKKTITENKKLDTKEIQKQVGENFDITETLSGDKKSYSVTLTLKPGKTMEIDASALITS